MKTVILPQWLRTAGFGVRVSKRVLPALVEPHDLRDIETRIAVKVKPTIKRKANYGTETQPQ